MICDMSHLTPVSHVGQLVKPLSARPLSALMSSQVLPRDDRDIAVIQLRTTTRVTSPAGTSEHPPGDVKLPVGGPYTLAPSTGPAIEDVWVGDLWVLAGQSNMQGHAPHGGSLPAVPSARCRGTAGRWTQAGEPLHPQYLGPDGMHLDPRLRAWSIGSDAYDGFADGTGAGGAGPGHSFAETYSMTTGVPVGLLACALGATSLGEWRPGFAESAGRPPGQDLFGFLRQAVLSAGPVRGVLWYQGETDACFENLSTTYCERFLAWTAQLRDELGAPRLPVITVQLAPLGVARMKALVPDFREGNEGLWTQVREAQRQAALADPDIHVVAAGDLQEHDGIHIDLPSAERLGRRLAAVALQYAPGLAAGARTAPVVTRAVLADHGKSVVLQTAGVNGGLRIDGPCPMTCSGARVSDVIAEGTSLRATLAGRVEPGATIAYGAGFVPDLCVHDDADMALPAFGPIRIDVS